MVSAREFEEFFIVVQIDRAVPYRNSETKPSENT